MTQRTTRRHADPSTTVSIPSQTQSPFEWACIQWFWARGHETWDQGLRELAAMRKAAVECGWIEIVISPSGAGRARRQIRLTSEGLAALKILCREADNDV